MIDIDTKKVFPEIKNKWDAIKEMGNAQQNVLEALHIFDSILENRSSEDWEFHENAIIQFVSKFGTLKDTLP